MRFCRSLWLPILIALVVTMGLGWVGAEAATKASKAETTADWKFHDIISVGFVKDWAKVPKPDKVMIIDARPKHKYIKGHIPTAIHIPYSKFDQLKGQLPEDKSTILIYYCGGLK